jgi:hypothetical protein
VAAFAAFAAALKLRRSQPTCRIHGTNNTVSGPPTVKGAVAGGASPASGLQLAGIHGRQYIVVAIDYEE